MLNEELDSTELLFLFNKWSFLMCRVFFCHLRKQTDVPSILIKTAGSLEGTCGRNGRISSKTVHLSMYSNSLPKLNKHCTLIYKINKYLVWLLSCMSDSTLGLLWLWSYGSWFYNYLCNKCLSEFESCLGEVYSIQHYMIKFVSDLR